MKKLAICFALLLVTCVSGIVPDSNARADEPAQAFLDALRENGYYDIAIDYLTQLESSNLASDDFRKVLPFEKAETLIASTVNIRDIDKLESRLNQAQQLLDDYVGGEHSIETLALTKRYQGNLFYRRARVYSTRADSDRLTAGEKAELGGKTREMLNASLACYKEARQKVRSLIDENSPDLIQIDMEDPSTTAKKKQFQSIYTQIRIRLPLVIEQLADTYPFNDPTGTKLLQDAVAEYNIVYEAYYKYPAGLDARLFAARCSQKLGNHEKALADLEDIFNLNDSSALKVLKRKAFTLASSSWSKIDPYPHSEIVARLQSVVGVLSQTEMRQPDWLRIQVELANAMHLQAASIKAAGGAGSSSDSKAIDRNAARLLKTVSRIPSPHRDQAKKLLSDWNINLNEKEDATEKPIETFFDARQKARDYADEIGSLINDANRLKRELASAPESEKATAAADLESMQQEIDETSNSALKMLELALEKIDDTVVRTDLNDIRYLQCFCYFATGQYYESALIGEFLLAKYPTVQGSRRAMTWMLQSYTRLHDEADKSDRAFERDRLNRSCASVVDRWPGSDQAGSAANIMTKLSTNENDFATAADYFAKVPQRASYRSSLASRLGQRLWFDYKTKTKEQTANQETLSKILADARKYLEIGAQDTTADNLTYELAYGSRLLVDAHLESKAVDQAVEQLETASLDFVKQKHPAIAKSSMGKVFNRETYKLAIKTYLAAMRKNDDKQTWIDKVRGALAPLRDELNASNDPKDRQRVTGIERYIAQELKKQFEQFETIEDKSNFAQILATFMGSIEKDSTDATTVLWSGETLLGVAEGLSQLGANDVAKPLFQQAESALNRAESLGFAGDPREAAMKIKLSRQRALSQRGAGKFEAAMDQLKVILKQNPMSLQVQVDAADTLHLWAKSAKRSKGYAEAMMGMEKIRDPKTKKTSNLIWGWRGLVKATQGSPKYVDTYFHSMYHLIESRFEYGLIEKSSKAIKSSLNDINRTIKQGEKKMDEVWKQKFANLQDRIMAESK